MKKDQISGGLRKMRFSNTTDLKAAINTCIYDITTGHYPRELKNSDNLLKLLRELEGCLNSNTDIEVVMQSFVELRADNIKKVDTKTLRLSDNHYSVPIDYGRTPFEPLDKGEFIKQIKELYKSLIKNEELYSQSQVEKALENAYAKSCPCRNINDTIFTSMAEYKCYYLNLLCDLGGRDNRNYDNMGKFDSMLGAFDVILLLSAYSDIEYSNDEIEARGSVSSEVFLKAQEEYDTERQEKTKQRQQLNEERKEEDEKMNKATKEELVAMIQGYNEEIKALDNNAKIEFDESDKHRSQGIVLQLARNTFNALHSLKMFKPFKQKAAISIAGNIEKHLQKQSQFPTIEEKASSNEGMIEKKDVSKNDATLDKNKERVDSGKQRSECRDNDSKPDLGELEERLLQMEYDEQESNGPRAIVHQRLLQMANEVEGSSALHDKVQQILYNAANKISKESGLVEVLQDAAKEIAELSGEDTFGALHNNDI